MDILNFQSGAQIDTRPREEKEKDYLFKEIVASANPVDWKEKNLSDLRRFPVQDQGNSGSCVAQTMKKILGVLHWLKYKIYVSFSATHIYQRRPNRPDSGMAGVDAFNIARDGVTLEMFANSEKLTDAQMDALQIPEHLKKVGEVFKLGNFIICPVKNIDLVASIIETTGKAVMVWFYFTGQEWGKLEPIVVDPNLPLQSQSTARHSTTATDYLLYKGKKALFIEDSAHFAGFTEHIITEDFFNARNWFVAYPMNFVFEDKTETKPVENEPTNKPKHTFKQTLEFGMEKPDIVALQDILKYEGFFPVNIQSTGYFGAITAKGVYQWQVKHKVAPMGELGALQGRRVGDKTIKALNLIYS